VKKMKLARNACTVFRFRPRTCARTSAPVVVAVPVEEHALRPADQPVDLVLIQRTIVSLGSGAEWLADAVGTVMADG
jgi:hypothetical protein